MLKMLSVTAHTFNPSTYAEAGESLEHHSSDTSFFLQPSWLKLAVYAAEIGPRLWDLSNAGVTSAHSHV